MFTEEDVRVQASHDCLRVRLRSVNLLSLPVLVRHTSPVGR